MRKLSALFLASALALAGASTSPVTSSHAATVPLPTVDTTDPMNARDLQPKEQVERVAVPMPQVRAKDSTTYVRHSPKRRYHRQHWRRVYKGW